MTNKFGKNLKEVRTFLGLTSVELAGKTGLTQACISQIEHGKREPCLGTITKLVEALGVKFERLIK